MEYVLSIDMDDQHSVTLSEGVDRLLNPPDAQSVTAVRNWNEAAAKSRGDVLFVIADDLFPPEGWDTALVELIGPLDPLRTPFAVKLRDSPDPADSLVRHPVISRAFYERFGLFSQSYHGLYCDSDFTTRAYWRSIVLDGRSLRLEHLHPTLSGETPPSESHRRVNRVGELERGRLQYVSTWSRRQRRATVTLAPTPPRSARSASAGRRWTYHARSNLLYAAELIRVVPTAATRVKSALRRRFSRF